MYVTIVDVQVNPEHIDEFIEATRLNHEASIKEKGNRRFDILQDMTDPGKFILYEAYTTQDEAKAHKETLHYATWRESVAMMMAKPREGVPYNGLFPKD